MEINAWTCINIDASTTNCTVTSSSSPMTASTTASSTVAYGDWLFMNVLILFCVAFIPVGTLFSLIPRKR